MLKLALVVGLMMVAGTVPMLPKLCKSPPVMTMQGQAINRTEQSITNFEIQYDAANKRKVMTVQATGWQPGRIDHRYIALNDKNIQYYINYVTNECVKSVPPPWYDIGAPPDGTYKESYYFGGSDEKLQFNMWTGRAPYNAPWVGTFSKKKCYPIWYFILGSHQQVTDSTNLYFFDIKEEINSKEFAPPPVCINATWGVFTAPAFF